MQSVHAWRTSLFALLVLILVGAVSAAPQVTVHVAQPGAEISPTMYGVFFEDINFGADGGLYAELIKNRSFEFPQALTGWQFIKRDRADGRILVLPYEDNGRNLYHVRIHVFRQGQGLGLHNEGFRGMGVREGVPYRFSVAVRQAKGTIRNLRVELVDPDGSTLAEGHISGITDNWQTLTCSLTPTKTEAKATLNLWIEGGGVVDMDMISLFPTDTWKGRKNGLRKDMVQLLADMKPGFLRFPGGCIVEGFDLAQRYQWKNTIGEPSQRALTINRWNFEFGHRPTPDYFQSFGIGFYEYFLLAEDLNAEPMPILNCGMACQFNTGELVPMDQLDPFIRDALDLIEFANGPADSEWGKVRADMGHPEPFNMKMIGVGNEQWGPQYVERYKVFAKAIKEKYPDMQLIAATGSDATIFPPGSDPTTPPNGRTEIDYLWSQWRILEPEIVDEHFYRRPDWFLENVDWYDDYEREGPKLFVGEYGSQSVGVASPNNRNLWKCALYEAAFMTGMERNADLVVMSCYAPLFGHEEAWQWRPDMIYFDNLNAYGTANYHVQKLFSLHPGTHQLSAAVSGAPALDETKQGLHASATLDEEAGEVIVKVVNVTDGPLETTMELQGVTRVGPSAKVILLASDALTDENSLQEPRKIYPKEMSTPINNPKFTYAFQPYSLTILRVPVQ